MEERMPDKDIVDLYWARDEQAIRETQNKYGAYCHSVAMGIPGDESDAEECVNDTYLGAWNSIPPHQPSILRTYLGKITRNLSINRLNAGRRVKRNRDLEVALEELDDCIPMPDDTRDEDLCEALDTFLDHTETLDRKLFMGRYWYARTVAQLASHYGLTPNAVSQRLKRTRQRLRAFLPERGYSV